MKRKTLTTAVLAGLTGMAGMVSVSHAVNVNPDGLGQALLYPYYSVRGDNDTLISIVNTSDQAKSVKIRFLEGLNSREVLDFNIYMSEFDVWVAAVTADGEGAKLLVSDRTCTVPNLLEEPFNGEVSFLDFEFTGANDDGGPQGLERLQSGYFEVLEMGTLVDDTDGSATAATHVEGVPADCQQLVDAWTTFTPADPATSYWLFDPTIDHEAPSGGLFGGASIINVPGGTMLTYNATALDAWNDAISHTEPGSVLPRLNDGNTTSNVFINGVVDTQTWQTGNEAVNATIMFDAMMNEYVIAGSANALSEWVVTFPTKRFHVDQPGLGIDPVIPPFTVLWTEEEGSACEPVTFRLWDREEQELGIETPPPGPPIISPPPPAQDPVVDRFELCWETNVIRFANEEDAVIEGSSEILNEPRFITLQLPNEGFNAGWARFDFGVLVDDFGQPTGETRTSRASAAGDVYVGLPVIGFWANTFTHNALVFDGQTVLSNFGGSFNHRGSRQVQAAAES